MRYICSMKKTKTETKLLYFLFLLSLGAVAILLAGCERERKSQLNASEVFLGKCLASISADPYSADRFFVGTEDGDVFVYNGASGAVDTLHTSFDRIYKVLPDSSSCGLRYWVGMRNRGLYLCSLRADSLRAERHYVLPSAEGRESYSAYDMCATRSGVYVATSNGLMRADGDAARVLAPVFAGKVGRTFPPMVVSDMLDCGDGTVLCASDSGLLRVDGRSGKAVVLLRRKVSSVALHGNDVMALVGGDTLMLVGRSGRRLGAVALPHHAQVCRYDGLNAMNYLLSDDRIQLFRDAEYSRPGAWRQMDAGASVPVNGHNVFVADSRRHQSLLVGKYSLRRVANHQDVFNSVGEVRLACADAGNIYYLVGTRLFRQQAGGDEAVQLKDITGSAGDVKFMQVVGDALYYVDNAGKAYRAPLYSSYFKNALFSFDRPVSPQLAREATAMGTDGRQVYVGVRDGVVSLDRADSLLLDRVYVNRFARRGGSVAFCTLNDGVFTGRGGMFRRVAGSDKFPFVRDVAFASSGKGDRSADLYVLTNHSLLVGRDGGHLSPVRTATGYHRLLADGGGRLYGVADFGIDSFADSVRLLPDIHFEPEACVAVGGRVYAGSASGVYVFGGSGEGGGYSMVRFVTKSLYTPANVLILVLAVGLLVASVWWRDRRRHRHEALASMQLRLRARVDELCKVSSMLDDDLRRQIDKWKNEIDGMSRLDPDETSSRADELNKDIQGATFRVPAVLSQRLELQIEQLEACRPVGDSCRRISNCKNARSGGDMNRMYGVLVDNDRWLRQLHDDEALVESVAAAVDGLGDVPNVSVEINRVLRSDVTPAEKLELLRGIVGGNDVKGSSPSRLSVADELKRYLSSPQIVEEIRRYGCAEYDKLKSWKAANTDLGDEPLLLDITTALSADYEATAAMLGCARPDVRGALSRLRVAGCRRDVLMAIVEVRGRTREFFDIRKEMKREGLDEKAMRERLDVLVSGLFERGVLVDGVKAFYSAADKSDDKCLFSKIGLKRKKGDALSLSEILLVLLMADGGRKVSAFSAITNVNNPESGKQHLRKLRRDITANIGGCREFLEAYADGHRSSFAPLLLALCKAADADS